MINDKNLKQEGGTSSTNLQGQTVNVYNGLTYSDAKDIAIDVFNSNFIKLKSEAAEIASKRAEEITEKIVNQLIEKSPESLNEFNNPAMQDALFQTQKEYAKSGDEELGDLLVDILIDRAKTKKRNMMQLVLNESLIIAPKLTIEHFDILTLNFITTRTVNSTIINIDTFKSYINDYLVPFSSNLTSEEIYFNHIEYLGCGHIRAGNYGKLEDNIKRRYQGVFSKGFLKEDFENEVGVFESFKEYIIPCLHDTIKYQFRFLTEKLLVSKMESENIDIKIQKKLKAFFAKTTMSNIEIKNYIISINKNMEKIFNLWQGSVFNKLELSSVGIAIAHANYRRKTGNTMDLSIWIK